MSASKSDPLKLFPQSPVSALLSLLNIWQQDCHFPFSFCKVHIGPYTHVVAEIPSYDLFFHMEKFSKSAQLSHDVRKIKMLSLQALFLLHSDIRALFVW